MVLPYQDESLPFNVRAADLVSRMTLEEKVAQFRAATSGMTSMAVARLGVRPYTYWNEALHGVARSNLATEFPTGLGIAATWDRGLVQSMTEAISDEARVKMNDCLALDAAGQPTAALTTTNCKGLTYWSPTINLAREPRWGRADESYGEDPWLSGEIAGQFVLGLQGGNESKPDSVGQYLKAVSTPKHYLANDSEVNRHDGTSNLSERSLHEYYTAHFAKAVGEYGAKSYMTSYNAYNVTENYTSLTGSATVNDGVESDFAHTGSATEELSTPVPASKYANDTLMRRTFGFDGFVTSDCGAIVNVYNAGAGFSGGHSWHPPELGRRVTQPEGSAYSLKAGTDVDCAVGTWSYPRSSATSTTPSHLENSQTAGLTTEQDWDIALTRAFTVRMQTGEFDAVNPYRNAAYTIGTAGENSVASPEHLDLAHKMSLEAPVLLKNEDSVLPFTNKTGSTVIVGYYGTHPIHGGYSPGATTVTKSAYQGLVDYLPPTASVTAIDSADLSFYTGAKPLPPYNNSQVTTVGAPALSYRQSDSTQLGVVPWNAATWSVDGSGFTDNASGTYRIRAGAALTGWMEADVTIPANTDLLQLAFADGATLPDADAQPAGCLASAQGCKTIGKFTVEAGGPSVDIPLYKKEVQTGASNVVARYAPLQVSLTDLGLSAGD
ncbi:MAG: hypothetical protein LBD90_00535, partial [Bifidobacteriaceae bacterium]|nr:hypothetical protein [Bifidobacteriaceae bacterium]